MCCCSTSENLDLTLTVTLTIVTLEKMTMEQAMQNKAKPRQDQLVKQRNKCIALTVLQLDHERPSMCTKMCLSYECF